VEWASEKKQVASNGKYLYLYSIWWVRRDGEQKRSDVGGTTKVYETTKNLGI